MKRIGIVGGLGPESSALYYRLAHAEVRRLRGGRHSARLVLDSLDFGEWHAAQERGDDAAGLALLVASARRLERAEAELLVVACNTAHRFAEAIEASVSVPFLHVADPVNEALRRDGRRRVALLGTRATMEEGWLAARLAAGSGVEVRTPDAGGRAELQRIILDELVAGVVRPPSLETLRDQVGALADAGADAVVLACTELALFAPEGAETPELPLPCYDTTRLHVRAAVARALEPAATGRASDPVA